MENKYDHKNWWHDKLTEDAKASRLRFANELASLIKERWDGGRSLHGVKVLAASNAGIGNGSWCARAAYNARRSGASRFLRHEIVVSRLEELGIIVDKGAHGGFRKK